MDYKFILKHIRPSAEEKKEVEELSKKLMNYIDKICEEESIAGKAKLVGSASKKTWLSGKSDIDIFIRFPLETPMEILKEAGLRIGYKVNELMDGTPNEHYASHPYLTCDIEDYEVDFVPCYGIKSGEQLKSAVDRTILHTDYIKANLDEKQTDDVLLLKKFMDCVGVYGSEFKTGGFAGYLCELLILEYESFENTLENVANWKYNTVIDIENYHTIEESKKKFKDPLVFIDPTDKNRNVAAALRLEKMVEFILASRNFLKVLDDEDLDEEEKEFKLKEYFTPLQKGEITKEGIIEDFNKRGSKTYLIKFNIPEVSADALHPQLKKTIESLSEKLEDAEFSVFKSQYWTDEDNLAIFVIELNVYQQNNITIHKGPKIWSEIACNNFMAKRGDNCYPLDDFLVLTKEREFKTAEEYIKHILKKENIHIIKVGKNIKKSICETYSLELLEEGLNNLDLSENEEEFLNILDDFLRPGQYIKR